MAMQERSIFLKGDKLCRMLVQRSGRAGSINAAVGKMNDFDLTGQSCWKGNRDPPPTCGYCWHFDPYP